jgi:hypothetical protein
LFNKHQAQEEQRIQESEEEQPLNEQPSDNHLSDSRQLGDDNEDRSNPHCGIDSDTNGEGRALGDPKNLIGTKKAKKLRAIQVTRVFNQHHASQLLKPPQEELKELRQFQQQTISFEQSLREEVMAKINVFLDHAARYIMDTPEASMFTNSLPQPFLQARQDNERAKAMPSEYKSSPFFGPVVSPKLQGDIIRSSVFRSFKSSKAAEKKEKREKTQSILKSVLHDQKRKDKLEKRSLGKEQRQEAKKQEQQQRKADKPRRRQQRREADQSQQEQQLREADQSQQEQQPREEEQSQQELQPREGEQSRQEQQQLLREGEALQHKQEQQLRKTDKPRQKKQKREPEQRQQEQERDDDALRQKQEQQRREEEQRQQEQQQQREAEALRQKQEQQRREEEQRQQEQQQQRRREAESLRQKQEQQRREEEQRQQEQQQQQRDAEKRKQKQQPSKQNAHQKTVQKTVSMESFCRTCEVKLGLGHCPQCVHHKDYPPQMGKRKRRPICKSDAEEDIFALVSSQLHMMQICEV